jgi:hypothetical protein
MEIAGLTVILVPQAQTMTVQDMGGISSGAEVRMGISFQVLAQQ